MVNIRKLVVSCFISMILSACALDPYAPATMPQEDLSYDSYIVTQSGCKVRWLSKTKAAITGLTWTGDCDANGYASGTGTLTQTYRVGDSSGTGQSVTAMVDGLDNGPISSVNTFTFRGVVHRTESTGYARAGKSVGETKIVNYEDGRLESTYSVVNAGGKVTVQKTGSGAPIQPTQSDDSDNFNSGLQIFGTILNTAIQAQGMKDAAASQRAYQAATNQQVRANAATLAQAQLAAAQRQQAAAQVRQQIQAQQVASAKPHSQNATQCVRQDDNQLINTCSETITVVWCVVGDGSNCNRGLDMESDIRAGGSTPALPLKHPGVPITVNYAACTGWMTAVAQGMQAKCD